jgi:hypothetical protein
MKKKILWLRISYWAGIIVDAGAAILMLFPRLFLRFMNVNVDPSPGFSYGLRYGAPLMIGWTVLLFWADRKPMERKDILPITLFPVVVGYIVFEIYSIVAGLATLGQTIPTLIMQAGLIALFTFSYSRS